MTEAVPPQPQASTVVAQLAPLSEGGVHHGGDATGGGAAAVPPSPGTTSTTTTATTSKQRRQPATKRTISDAPSHLTSTGHRQRMSPFALLELLTSTFDATPVLREARAAGFHVGLLERLDAAIAGTQEERERKGNKTTKFHVTSASPRQLPPLAGHHHGHHGSAGESSGDEDMNVALAIPTAKPKGRPRKIKMPVKLGTGNRPPPGTFQPVPSTADSGLLPPPHHQPTSSPPLKRKAPSKSKVSVLSASNSNHVPTMMSDVPASAPPASSATSAVPHPSASVNASGGTAKSATTLSTGSSSSTSVIPAGSSRAPLSPPAPKPSVKAEHEAHHPARSTSSAPLLHRQSGGEYKSNASMSSPAVASSAAKVAAASGSSSRTPFPFLLVTESIIRFRKADVPSLNQARAKAKTQRKSELPTSVTVPSASSSRASVSTSAPAAAAAEVATTPPPPPAVVPYDPLAAGTLSLRQARFLHTALSSTNILPEGRRSQATKPAVLPYEGVDWKALPHRLKADSLQ